MPETGLQHRSWANAAPGRHRDHRPRRRREGRARARSASARGSPTPRWPDLSMVDATLPVSPGRYLEFVAPTDDEHLVRQVARQDRWTRRLRAVGPAPRPGRRARRGRWPAASGFRSTSRRSASRSCRSTRRTSACCSSWTASPTRTRGSGTTSTRGPSPGAGIERHRRRRGPGGGPGRDGAALARAARPRRARPTPAEVDLGGVLGAFRRRVDRRRSGPCTCAAPARTRPTPDCPASRSSWSECP